MAWVQPDLAVRQSFQRKSVSVSAIEVANQIETMTFLGNLLEQTAVAELSACCTTKLLHKGEHLWTLQLEEELE